MKRVITFSFLSLVIFTLGFLSGRIGTLENAHQFHPAKEAPERPARTATSRHADTSNSVDPDGILDELGELRHKDEEFAAKLSDLDAMIPELLAAMEARAGLSGLNYQDEDVLEKALFHWYDQDPDAALEWANALGNPKDRMDLLEKLVGKESKNDFDHAMQLAESYLRDEDGKLEVPTALSSAAVEAGPDGVVRLAALSVSSHRDSFGFGETYPPGFDFQATLTELASLAGSLGDDGHIGYVPSNLLEEWAKIEPQAAYDWLSEGHEVTLNDDIDDFLNGYATVVDGSELGTFAAEAFDPEKHERERYEIAVESLKIKLDASVLEAFLEGVGGDPSMHLEGLLHESFQGTGGSNDEARLLLLRRMTPEQRTQFIRSADDWVHQSDRHREWLHRVLEPMGHGKAEIDAMLTKANTGD